MSAESALVDPDLRRLLIRIAVSEVEGWDILTEDGDAARPASPGFLPMAACVGVVACVVALGSALSVQPLPTKTQLAAIRHAASAHGPRAHAARPQVLAWAPVSGVRSYEVTIYRDGVPILWSRTDAPRLALHVSSHPKSSRALRPGAYAWYVWPIRHGHPVPPALVSSTIVLAAP
jgi:hypothetical protein